MLFQKKKTRPKPGFLTPKNPATDLLAADAVVVTIKAVPVVVVILRFRRGKAAEQNGKTKNRKHRALQRHNVSSITGNVWCLPSLVRGYRLQGGFLTHKL